jgi:hypothetical protein
MRPVSFDLVDDAELELGSATISLSGDFTMTGIVEFGGAFRPRRRRYSILMRVPAAFGFQLDDAAQIGILIAESVEELDDRVLVRGVIPTNLTVFTSRQSRAEFEIGDGPVAICRRGRWVQLKSPAT